MTNPDPEAMEPDARLSNDVSDEDISGDLTDVQWAEIDDLIKQTELVGHDAALEALKAEANKGVPALIVDPSENTMLWYVSFPETYLTTVEEETRFKRIAREIIAWTEELTEEERRRLARASGGNGGTTSNGGVKRPATGSESHGDST